ncbi:transglutaminase domain-containing protein [Legionella septentrionalis]|uniref:Transglutaminase-like domain-containing protein n=1 Tax=Legionella septentrionalis TaxID=2498109 RepID=A0A433JGC9_9GAMM|nr:transglutaminase domain-containing protein [Legionella septentrionalis]RUQ79169.1 hypothetical protein EKM59_11470 [Legionella septentrionalis]RUQ93504.1 hypothetical protein ELY11_11800 [Legionella septentrionalis]RUR09425.1 hypothetical protein ELY14_08765 [Legionella septentrionalis]RUR16149.1 hypothetical protein ELY10_04420 [Legionella septentrionalis]
MLVFKIFFAMLILLVSIASAAKSDFSKSLYCNDYADSIQKYACLTEHAVQGIKWVYESSGIKLTDDETRILQAIEAMNLIQNIASAGRYAYLKHTQREFKSPLMHEQNVCLQNSFGICGNHQYLFVEILKHLGLSVRPVDFYYSFNHENHNHAAAEIYVNDHWAFFDITWGGFWVQHDLFTPLSLEAILKRKGTLIAGSNSWYIAKNHLNRVKHYPDVFSYLHGKDLQILRNKSGILRIRFKNGEADFNHLPNYFGKSENGRSLKIKFQNPAALQALLHIENIGGYCEHSYIKAGSQRFTIVKGSSRLVIPPNGLLEIEGKDPICYLVIKNLKEIAWS